MPGRYRERRLENAVIRVSEEQITDKYLYNCLWEILEAVMPVANMAGDASPYQREETVLHEND